MPLSPLPNFSQNARTVAGVPAAVGVMEGNIEEKRPAGGGMGLAFEVRSDG